MAISIERIVQRVVDLADGVVYATEQGEQAHSCNQESRHWDTAILVPFVQGVWYRLPDERQHELFGTGNVLEGRDPVLLGRL